MSASVRSILNRQIQLNALSYFLILALLAASGMLVYLVTTAGVLPNYWVLGDDWVRWLTIALLLSMVVYLALSHQRMSRSLLEVTTALELSEHEYRQSCDRLSFAHAASEVMTGTDAESALHALLEEVLDHFDADAAAVVGSEVTIVSADCVDSDVAYDAVLAASLETVRAGEPLAQCGADDESSTLAVPLRIQGRLRDVLCVWRQHGVLPADQLEGFQLVARVVELGMGNRELFDEQRARVDGMLDALLELSDQRFPGYLSHAVHVADLADAVAKRMQFTEGQRADLRIAALLHDIGMLELPEGTRAPGSDGPLGFLEHPSLGARLASTARLGDSIQRTIESHHESIDGSGYPNKLTAQDIPLAARILAVCEAYSGMVTSDTRELVSSPEVAMTLIRMGAGKLYDPRVVRELQRVLGVPNESIPDTESSITVNMAVADPL